MNNRGQALIEFVLILPVFLMILFLIVDFGTIFTKKISLEETSSKIIDEIEADTELSDISKKYPKLIINVSTEDKYKKITITDYVDLITPGINKFMTDPYEIIIDRYVYYE